jgi:hypothetical protein
MSKQDKKWTKEQLEFQKAARKEIAILEKNPNKMLVPYEDLVPIDPKPKKPRKK